MHLSQGEFIIVVVYVDDSLFASNDTSLLNETKLMLYETFEMKDLDKASLCLVLRFIETCFVVY